METPSSTRRVTRSQTRAAASANNTNFPSSRKVEESMQKSVKNQQQDRSALFDITNDSPIVGLAIESLKTPSSAVSKKKMNNQGMFARTPGSGEALLRGQVKTLLQKVEEEAEMSKITPENRPFFKLEGLINSPFNLVAPTPANTPQIFNLEADGDGLPSATPVIDKFLIPQMLNEKNQGSIESESQITRTLVFDFSEKSEKVSTDDDDSSVWSIQVNASTREDDEEDDESCNEEEDYEEEEEEEEEEYQLESSRWLLDDVCEGISKISVKEGPKFEGKHIRFVYNSDGEIEEEALKVTI